MRHATQVVLLLVSLAGAATSTHADPVSATGRDSLVELQAEATREVANDLMRATLFVEVSDASPVRVAEQLNRGSADALRTASGVASVRTASGGMHTHPVYDRQQRLIGWRGRAELRLESRDVPDLSALIGRLQATMQVGGVSFTLSPERRRQVEDELTAEAVAAFRERAAIAVQAIGAKTFRIRRLALNTGHAPPVPRPYAARALAAQVEAPPPAFEAGTSTVRVTAAGTLAVD